MFKKYPFILFIVVFVFLFQFLSAHALRFSPAKSTAYQPVVNYTAYVVSNTDFGDTILAQATSSPNISLTFTAIFGNSGNTVSFGSVMTNASGIAQAFGNYDWLNEYTNKVFVNGQTKQAEIVAKDTVANLAGTARYNITIYAETIGITGTVDGASFTWGGTLAQGKTLKTTCTNSTNMKVGLDGGPYSSVGTKNGYTITYDFPNNNTGTTALTYKIICQNIGGTANEQARTFNLAPTIPSPSGNINATGCTILSGASTCNGSINWTTTNPTHTSQVTSNYPA
ncbi:MAG: hypothetical protein PHQ01_04510, partial [Candidatus Pacebacteria bacterium]|nr:hypothetical protein [Candidatus Paceibacterota bacterium]